MSRSEQPRDLKTLVFLSFFAQFFFGGEVNDNEKNAIGMVVIRGNSVIIVEVLN
ncbi:hypothetical protein JHK82_022374 [Glycine max]|uniref:LSM domain-containing protein n=1 Tax=Glycine max TaxID=3847 RepID=A0A0R0IS52_SOYBN|nr:hypothetical protein JHK87_022287 [Glycine soja]KAG5016723.1 hypothetical protein JHK85_022859 [Glycine max]KAG5026478.1 hypothetical protein JHK86_022392 [Glycine max]KAG5137643.1 hypothetical protein JHK82_022374 [Glycine max]KAH1052974.1 hypothetical protein GYH30_022321 [Glycine max]